VNCEYPDDYTSGYVWPQVDNAFAPVLEDDSEDMIGSSPIGPMTPFAEYVDRAVSASDVATLCDIPLKQEEIHLYHGLQYYDMMDYQYADPIKQEPVAPVSDPAPTASSKYKKFAEPMADFIVSYVWKVCNNSIALPAAVSRSTYVNFSIWNLGVVLKKLYIVLRSAPSQRLRLQCTCLLQSTLF
jgi:hypothetical protein